MPPLLISSPVGIVEQMPQEEWLECRARIEICRYFDDLQHLASLSEEEFVRRCDQLAGERGEKFLALYDAAQRTRRLRGVRDRSYLTSRTGRTLSDGFLLYKGAELMWRLARGDTSGTGTLQPFGANAPLATDTENGLTYTLGASAKTYLDIGTNAAALADPGDRGLNTVRTLDPNANPSRQLVDSGYWVIKTVSNTPVVGSSIAQARWTVGSGSFPVAPATNLMAWNEFLVANNSARSSPWNNFANTALDIFVSQQGTKRSDAVWTITIEYTLA